MRAWQGENSLLQKTLEETQPGVEEEEEEDKLKTSQVKSGSEGPGVGGIYNGLQIVSSLGHGLKWSLDRL